MGGNIGSGLASDLQTYRWEDADSSTNGSGCTACWMDRGTRRRWDTDVCECCTGEDAGGEADGVRRGVILPIDARRGLWMQAERPTE